MTKIATAHADLLQFCKGQPGIGVGIELFTYLMKNAIAMANSGGHAGQLINFPSNNPWNGHFPVAFTMDLDPSNLKVEFDPLVDPIGNANPVPRLKISGISATFAIYVHDVLFGTHILDYSLILASFAITGKKLNLIRDLIQSQWKQNPPGDVNELWRAMTRLPDGTSFTNTLKNQWAIQQEAYKLLAQDAIGTSFIQAVTIPNILGMVKSFSFSGPISIIGTSELVMLTGAAEWIFGCPNRSAQTRFPAQSQQYLNKGSGGQRGVISAFSYKLPEGSPDASYPKEGSVEQVDSADVFVHLPKVFMEHRFDGIAKPSVTFSDEGTVAIIHWHYEAAIAPAPAGTLQISLTTPWPTEFKISLPLEAFGGAGAAVQIACISYEIAGVHFRGEIDPFEAYFRIGLDVANADLYFESRLGNVRTTGFSFDHFPSLGFPIDQIANFILGAVADLLVNHQAGAILNVTRFSLADFELFKGFGPLRNLLAAVPDAVATTYGVTFTKA